MKKTLMFTAVASLFLCVMVTAVQADFMDRPEEGNQVIAASKFMMAQAKKIQSAKAIDRAWLVDEGHLLVKHGYDNIESGEMLRTDEGISYMQQIGRKILEAGQIMLKMGRKTGPLTQAEKDTIAKQVQGMQGFGNLMLNNGQLMGGN
jgi:hypothetical protein